MVTLHGVLSAVCVGELAVSTISHYVYVNVNYA